MPTATFKRTIVLVALFQLYASTAFADLTETSSDAAITALQARHRQGENVFVVQDEIDSVIRQGGGGACASAAAIDAIQTLRLMAGKDPLSNPHKAALAAFVKQEELLNGRVSNDQFIALLSRYADAHLPEWKLTVDVVSTPYGPYLPKGKTWASAKGPDLSAAVSQLRIVTFTVTKDTGQMLGRHFVLLKRLDSQELTVLDPRRPLKDITYSITPRTVEDWGQRYFLSPPAKVKTTDTLEIDSVFTLRVEKGNSAQQAPTDVAVLTEQIDQLAATLISSGELRSPRKWRELSAKFGLPGLDLPIEYGGSGWSACKTLETFIYAGRYDLNCRDVVGGAHVRPLLKSSDERVLDIVRQVARGDAYMAITMTEPHAGSDFHSIKSTAHKVDGGYLLSGEKRYVARLEQATHVIIFTQPASGTPRGLSAFVLPLDTPGLEPYSFGAHGLKGNSFGGLRFKDVRVEDWQMLGRDGEGDDIFLEHFRYWRLMQVGTALGTAERALELTVDRLITREAYGAPIGRFSHLQQAVGQHTTELRMAKALAREAAEMLDRGEGDQADAIINGLKAEGVEIALATVDSATRAFGAEGYSDRVDLGNRLQDLNGLRIADGTTDVMRMSVVAKSYGKKGEKLWKMAVRSK
jgi:alkylation response protein AidB-like acyl-CoA dehydrogenase